MKWMLLFMVAIFIDGLQAVVELAMMGVVAFGGTIGGGAAGYYACSGASGWIASTCAAAGAVVGSFLDPATATLGEPFGIAIGFGIDIAISLTFGVFLLALLVFTNSFSFKSVGLNLPGSGSRSKLGWLKFAAPLVVMIPGLDLLPTWTMLVFVCWSEKRAQGKAMGNLAEKGALVGAAGIVDITAFRNDTGINDQRGIDEDEAEDAANAMYAYTENEVGSAPEEETSREPVLQSAAPLRSMDTDINPRAANDNTPKTYANAA